MEESAFKVDAPCEHFNFCGGCSVQQLDYEEQLNQKKQQVEDLFRRQAGIADFTVDKVIAADEHYNYRNKMEFSFSNRRWILPSEADDAENDFALGLHVPRRYDKILNINRCHIQPELGNDILNIVKSKARELNLKPYDVKTHIGFLRHLVLRFGHNTGDVMVNLVTSYENPELIKPLADHIHAQFPQVTSIINKLLLGNMKHSFMVSQQSLKKWVILYLKFLLIPFSRPIPGKGKSCIMLLWKELD